MDTNISKQENSSSAPVETLFIGLRYLLQVFACNVNFQTSPTGAQFQSLPLPGSP